MDKIAVFIKTCEGRPSVLWVLNSITFGLQGTNYRIYISDEEPLNDWKKHLYEELQREGHHIELHKKGMNVGVAKNQLLDCLNDEDFVLRMDDDFELGGEFRISALKTVLKSSKEIGFCADFERQVGKGRNINSGSLRPAGGYYIVAPPKLIKKFHSPFKKRRVVSGIRYSLAEHTRNLLLIKRDVFEKVRWNEQLKFMGEHSDFLMSIREAGYSGAYTPDSVHYHREDLALYRDAYTRNSAEATKRPGEEEMRNVYQERWSCDRIVTKYPVSWYILEAGRRLMAKWARD
ncbi:MAG: hypothetical protein WD355_00790 [Balneolaceae bacterium]